MTTLSLNSIGCVAQTLQRSPNLIARAATALAIEPVARINGINHYSDGQIELLRRYFEEQAK